MLYALQQVQHKAGIHAWWPSLLLVLVLGLGLGLLPGAGAAPLLLLCCRRCCCCRVARRTHLRAAQLVAQAARDVQAEEVEGRRQLRWCSCVQPPHCSAACVAAHCIVHRMRCGGGCGDAVHTGVSYTWQWKCGGRGRMVSLSRRTRSCAHHRPCAHNVRSRVGPLQRAFAAATALHGIWPCGSVHTAAEQLIRTNRPCRRTDGPCTANLNRRPTRRCHRRPRTSHADKLHAVWRGHRACKLGAVAEHGLAAALNDRGAAWEGRERSN